MKKTLKFSLLLFLAFGLVFPYNLDTSAGFNMPKTAAASVPVAASAPSITVASFKELYPQMAVVTQQGALSVKGCAALYPAVPGVAGPGLSGTIVQDQIFIDLNQPAGCFSFGPGKIALVPNLEVKASASSLPQVKVAAFKTVISPYKLIPSPFEPSNQALPIASWAGVAAFLVLLEKVIFRSQEAKKHHYHFALTLHQLQTMRC